jgi:hypothetical protein
MQVKGTQLSRQDRAYVLRAYVHRFTGEHKPNWANGTWKDGKPYPLQFKNDKDWLENTQFRIFPNGKLNKNARYCESHPTWPNNPELRH